jgi:Spy/CpxP family protein refolding chaperone
MKTRKSMAILLLMSGMALTAWNIVSAQDAPPPPPPVPPAEATQVPPPPPPPPPDDPEGFQGPARGLDIPDLTEDQQAKIKKIQLTSMEKMTPLKNQLHEKKARLGSLLTAKPADMNEAGKIADEIGDLMARMLKNKMEADQAIRAVLTDDQRVVFDAKPKPFLNSMRQMQPQPQVRKKQRYP